MPRDQAAPGQVAQHTDRVGSSSSTTSRAQPLHTRQGRLPQREAWHTALSHFTRGKAGRHEAGGRTRTEVEVCLTRPMSPDIWKGLVMRSCLGGVTPFHVRVGLSLPVRVWFARGMALSAARASPAALRRSRHPLMRLWSARRVG